MYVAQIKNILVQRKEYKIETTHKIIKLLTYFYLDVLIIISIKKKFCIISKDITYKKISSNLVEKMETKSCINHIYDLSLHITYYFKFHYRIF